MHVLIMFDGERYHGSASQSGPSERSLPRVRQRAAATATSDDGHEHASA